MQAQLVFNAKVTDPMHPNAGVQVDYSHSVCAILKCSSKPGSNPKGGIVGTAFFVRKDRLFTAHHGSSTLFDAYEGFQSVSVWLLARDGFRVQLLAGDISRRIPSIDLLIIKLRTPHSAAVPLTIERPLRPLAAGQPVSFIGYVAGKPEGVDFQQMMSNANVGAPTGSLSEATFRDRSAVVDEVVREFTLLRKDVEVIDQPVVVLRCMGWVGNSGGPLVFQHKLELAGFMFGGQPEDSPVKNVLFAVSRDALLRHV